MTTISLSLAEETYERLKELALERAAAPEDLLKAYVEYLIAGGAPLDSDDPPIAGILRLAELGGAFDWLKDEPDLYSLEDGEPYG